jgi:hypothetical protein
VNAHAMIAQHRRKSAAQVAHSQSSKPDFGDTLALPSGSFAFAAGGLLPGKITARCGNRTDKMPGSTPSGIPGNKSQMVIMHLPQHLDQRIVNRDRAHPFTPSWSP